MQHSRLSLQFRQNRRHPDHLFLQSGILSQIHPYIPVVENCRQRLGKFQAVRPNLVFFNHTVQRQNRVENRIVRHGKLFSHGGGFTAKPGHQRKIRKRRRKLFFLNPNLLGIVRGSHRLRFHPVSGSLRHSGNPNRFLILRSICRLRRCRWGRGIPGQAGAARLQRAPFRNSLQHYSILVKIIVCSVQAYIADGIFFCYDQADPVSSQIFHIHIIQERDILHINMAAEYAEIHRVPVQESVHDHLPDFFLCVPGVSHHLYVPDIKHSPENQNAGCRSCYGGQYSGPSEFF